MKIFNIRILLIISLSHFLTLSLSQKVGVGISTPEARLHIKGADNISQLCIDADTMQTNLFPLIRLRKSNGTDLMWIHSDEPSNVFIGLNAGKVNNPLSGTDNTA